MSSISSGSLITRKYYDLRGVDFSNDPGIVDLKRSPDALNMWKDYISTHGTCVETRPGYIELYNLNEKINGFFIYKNKAIVHSTTNLYAIDFPISEDSEKITLLTTMNDTKSQMYLFGGYLYINDGINYLKYDGSALKNVYSEAYVPTTTIGRKPSGGGEKYEDVNLLTGQRINTFLGDGSSTAYYLDATGINSIDKVTINDSVTTAYTVDLSQGKVVFNTAPGKPSIIGKDNVAIKFTKNVSGYRERILHCTIAKVFDNRIFFSGNPDFPNALFHSSVNAPYYISDLDYYEDGVETPIKSLVVGNNVLWVLKSSNNNKDTIFYHTPTIDAEYGRIYPKSQGNVSIGCYSKAFNYDDTIVFLSREGLESLRSSVESLQVISHKSSLVDNKMTVTNNYENAVIERWVGYLLIAIDNEIFLADNRKQFINNNNAEYEWFYWKIKDNITVLYEYNNELYFCSDTGKIFKFDGTNDNGEMIESHWTMPKDVFDTMQYLKTSNKRGAIAKMKNIPNSRVKIEVCTNKKDWKVLKEVSTSGFKYTDFSYDNFSYETGYETYAVFKIKIKKFIDYQLKFSSVEIDKPFGLYSCTLEAFLGSFVKR